MINIVFMGTPDFAVPTLSKLYNDNDIHIDYVVTKIDSKSNRGQKINFSDVKKKSIEYSLNILQPISIKNDREVIEKIKNAKPDFIVVVAYGQILSKEILDIPKYGCINGHASLLPKYRGAAPIQSAILNGEKITGTTAMLMDEGLDTGDILMQNQIEIEEKETSETLFNKLSYLTADTICYVIKNFKNLKRQKQDDTLSSKSQIIKKEFGKIDFENDTCEMVDRKVRAYIPWPSAYFEIDKILYKIYDVDIYRKEIKISDCKKFSDNIYIYGGIMLAKCKDGYISINEIQKSGKNKMKICDFINGLNIGR